MLWALYSTDDFTEATPFWNDATSKVRAFSTSRGRDSELQEIDAGTATVELDNRTRTFDPVSNSAIKPMNKWWLRSQFAGETQDLFMGYAERYDQTWPAKVGDAVAVVHCADEFKVLARENLPVMDPPRDTYGEVVNFDNPTGHWPMDDDQIDRLARPAFGEDGALGQNLTVFSAATVLNWNPLVKGKSTNSLRFSGGTPCLGLTVTEGGPGDVGSLTEFSFETWFNFSALPSGNVNIVTGPTPGGIGTFSLALLTTGNLTLSVTNDVPSTVTCSTTTPLVANTAIYHLVATWDGSNIKIYVNGAEAATAAQGGTFPAFVAGEPFTLCNPTGVTAWVYDHTAFYRHALSADRVAAHYTAGSARGFAFLQAAPAQWDDTSFKTVANDALDAIESQAPRSFQGSNSSVVQQYMRGQEVLSLLKENLKPEVQSSDSRADQMFFASGDGTLIYLNAGHRIVSPYDTVQMTFDDDGTDSPYLDLLLDYSDSFLFNHVTVTRENGLVQTAEDATSIAKYGKRSLSLTRTLNTDDGVALDLAEALLAKFKEPLTRITSITPDMSDTATAQAVLARELGDKIRVLRTPPGGGSRSDHSLWIQKIGIEGQNDEAPWQVVFGVFGV
jgi:hypothetical protein